MSVIEETIAATLDQNGQLLLTQTPRLPPGPVSVTIRIVENGNYHRGLTDVLRKIAEDQRNSSFPGLTTDEIDAVLSNDDDRDNKLEAARQWSNPKGE